MFHVITSLHPIMRLVLLVVCAVSTARAELKWEQKELSVSTRPDAEVVQVVYVFKNMGNTSVHISSVTTSCNCTTAQVAKPSCAPGESGEVKVRFEIGKRTGLQEKIITVLSNDGIRSFSTPLVLKIRILETAVAP